MKKILSIILFFILYSFSGYGQSVNYNETNSIRAKSSKKIKVYPNPATNMVNILGLENSSKANILIIDVYGNVVISLQWMIKNNALNIPIPTLSTGVYIVTIHSQEQNVQTKFYKQ